MNTTDIKTFNCLRSVYYKRKVESFLSDIESLLTSSDVPVLVQTLDSLYIALLTNYISKDYVRSYISILYDLLSHSHSSVSNASLLIISLLLDKNLFIDLKPKLSTFFSSLPSLSLPIIYLLSSISHIDPHFLHGIKINSTPICQLLIESVFSITSYNEDDVYLFNCLIALSSTNNFEKFAITTVELISRLIISDTFLTVPILFIELFLRLLWNSVEFLGADGSKIFLSNSKFFPKYLEILTLGNPKISSISINILILIVSHNQSFLGQSSSCRLISSLFQLIQSNLIGSDVELLSGVLLLLYQNLPIISDCLGETWIIEGLRSTFSTVLSFPVENQSNLIKNLLLNLVYCTQSPKFSRIIDRNILNYLLTFLDQISLGSSQIFDVFNLFYTFTSHLVTLSLIEESEINLILKFSMKYLETFPLFQNSCFSFFCYFLLSTSQNLIFHPLIRDSNFPQIFVSELSKENAINLKYFDQILAVFESLFFYSPYPNIPIDICNFLDLIFSLIFKPLNESSSCRIIGIITNIAAIKFDCLTVYFDTLQDLIVNYLKRRSSRIKRLVLVLLKILTKDWNSCQILSNNSALFVVLSANLSFDPKSVSTIILKLASLIVENESNIKARSACVESVEKLLKLEDRSISKKAVEIIVELAHS
ncbi:hypothetical protein RCL1_001663 [Eukaryota sp. TZLM3-RCL]